MLSDFFRINLPYGIAKNDKNEWLAFNREYMPLGFNNNKFKGMPGKSYSDLPVYSNYGNISEDILLSLADNENAVIRDDDDNIEKVFFYDDESNPVNRIKQDSVIWQKYFSKIITLSNLFTIHQS